MTGEVWPSLEWITTDGAVALSPSLPSLPAASRWGFPPAVRKPCCTPVPTSPLFHSIFSEVGGRTSHTELKKQR